MLPAPIPVQRSAPALLRRWRALAMLMAAALGLALGEAGAGVGAERALQDWRFSIRTHPASDQVALVEIDARSIAAIDHWPWPRRNYVQAIDRLRQAGAASIAFDVDFSSRSAAGDDQAFAAALDRAGGAVALPTIRQQAGGGAAGYLDSLPIPELRAHAMAAAVSILPDDDGVVRQAPLGIVTAGVPRPALSAMIAGRAGTAGRNFPIDFAIEPASVPRLSFIDIRDGRFDSKGVAGKRILIGATAVELGDRYGVPRFGVIYGAVIQALAAETLLVGVPVTAGWLAPLALALLFAPLILHARRRWALGAAALLGPIGLFGLGIAAEQWAGRMFQLVPAMAALAVAGTAALAARIAAELRRRRTVDEQTGMPNRLALVADHAGDGPLTIATARIADYDKLLAALGAIGAADMLRRVAERIAVLVGGTIYRIDDRVLAWREGADRDQLATRVDQLRRMMLAPVEVAGRRADVALAIGVAEGEGRDAATVLAHAALAASQARSQGVGWHLHMQAEADSVDREVSLLGELDTAIANGEIAVAYQPKLHIASDRVTGVEALVRWRHPERGFMPPDLFIPLAERGDRIAGLTLHVLERTIADLLAWEAAGAAIGAAVNISAKLLNAPEFLERARVVITASGLDPHRLTLEVTESAAMSDPSGAARSLAAIKALGVKISMDDYGTGLSTLTYLKQLPLDELKLDRSFVQFAHQNRSDAVLVRSTVELAHELGLKVVAEGVEEEACLAYLRSVGCDMAQGYLISKPTTADAILQLVQAGERQAA